MLYCGGGVVATSYKLLYIGACILAILFLGYMIGGSNLLKIGNKTYTAPPYETCLTLTDLSPNFISSLTGATTTSDYTDLIPIEDFQKFGFKEGYRCMFQANISDIDAIKTQKPYIVSTTITVFESPAKASEYLNYNISNSKYFEKYSSGNKLTSLNEINVENIGDETRGYHATFVLENRDNLALTSTGLQIRKGNYVISIEAISYDSHGLKEEVLRLGKIVLQRIN